MASTSPHIADYAAATADGTIPGKFVKGRTEWTFPTLAYAGARGATHLWTVRVKLIRVAEHDYVPMTAAMLTRPLPALAGYKAEISVESKQEGGKVRDVVPTFVSNGKNRSKANETNLLTQALRDALGLYNKKQKARRGVGEADEAGAPAGEAETHAPAGKTEAAAAGACPMPPPMLVQLLGKSKAATLGPNDFKAGITVQPKLNGVRLVAFLCEAEVVLYSRSTTRYAGQAHLRAELGPMLAAAPRLRPGTFGLPASGASAADRAALAAYGADPPGPSGVYLDGELFLKGYALQYISGQARKGDDEGRLQHHVFDCFFERAQTAGHAMVSSDRQAYLRAVFAAADAAGLAHPHVCLVPSAPAGSRAELDRLAAGYVREDYEGAIARRDVGLYEYGYSNRHSAQLLKIKPRPDAEFTVVGFTAGRKGKDADALIWICEAPGRGGAAPRRFTTVPRDLSLADRRALFACLGEKTRDARGRPVTRFELGFKGRPLTVEYAELSADGVPLQGRATVFRTYEGGPDADPVRAALAECAARGGAAAPAPGLGDFAVGAGEDAEDAEEDAEDAEEDAAGERAAAVEPAAAGAWLPEPAEPSFDYDWLAEPSFDYDWLAELGADA